MRIESALAGDVMAAACLQVFEQMEIGVVACDHQLSVLAVTPTARALLSEFGGDQRYGYRLPTVVSDAASAYLSRAESVPGCARVAPIRIETPDGLRAVHVASKRIKDRPPLAVVVRLHEDRFADKDLFDALRDHFDLSSRDRRLIVLLRQGRTNVEMAQVLGLTVGTVKVYVHELYEKFEVHSRWELLAFFERIRAER